MHGTNAGGATTVTNSNPHHLIKLGGWNVSTLTLHIAARREQGASGQEIASFLRCILGSGQQAELETALRRCGYDPEGGSLVSYQLTR